MSGDEQFEEEKFSRRSFVKGSAALTAGMIVSGSVTKAGELAQMAESNTQNSVPLRALGKTGAQVSALGVGGYHLGSTKDQQEATELVAKAMDAGVNFFDNCWEYHDGLSEERMGVALQGKRERAFVMTKVCTHGRSKDVAMKQLEESLRRLKTDHIDLWQIHEVVYFNDPELIFAPNGAAEALAEAKQQGKVRFIGFTGHKDPAIHLKMMAHNFPFDAVQMPLNCLDASFHSFETQVLPEANKRGLGVLGMKSLGGSGELVSHGVVTAAEGLRYAMSLPVATTISGMDSIEVLEQNLRVAQGFTAMSHNEMAALREKTKMFAGDGRYELFKTSTKYDGKTGREQHHFPTIEKLPT